MVRSLCPVSRLRAACLKGLFSDDPAAEKTCEDLLNLALQTDPGNNEALQALASVRMSQERPDDAKVYLEQAWTSWKDLDLGMPSATS